MINVLINLMRGTLSQSQQSPPCPLETSYNFICQLSPCESERTSQVPNGWGVQMQRILRQRWTLACTRPPCPHLLAQRWGLENVWKRFSFVSLRAQILLKHIFYVNVIACFSMLLVYLRRQYYPTLISMVLQHHRI